jgi:hypothetical protein
MGGAVAAVTKPVVKAFSGGGGSSAPAQAPTPAVEKVAQRASRAEEEMGARMRGARRRGRQLISDARLNPEAGVETLGGGNNLG